MKSIHSPWRRINPLERPSGQWNRAARARLRYSTNRDTARSPQSRTSRTPGVGERTQRAKTRTSIRGGRAIRRVAQASNQTSLYPYSRSDASVESPRARSRRHGERLWSTSPRSKTVSEKPDPRIARGVEERCGASERYRERLQEE